MVVFVSLMAVGICGTFGHSARGLFGCFREAGTGGHCFKRGLLKQWHGYESLRIKIATG